MEYSRPSITVCCKEKWTVRYFLSKLYNFQFRDRPLEEKKGFSIPNTLLVISKAWWTESTEHLPWARELEMMADFQHERKYDFIQQRGRKVGDTMGRWGPSWCLRMDGSLQTACSKNQTPEGIPEQTGLLAHFPGFSMGRLETHTRATPEEWIRKRTASENPEPP